MRKKQSEYMNWAKTQSRARFNLATSGVGAFPLSELGALPPLEINGDNSYGYAPLQCAIAERQGVDPACVVTAAGTSGANYLAFATLLEPGDEVVVEHPTYGLLVDSLEYVGAVVKRFARTPENGFALDPAAVRRAVTPRTRLIVITNLHNPSSVLAGEAELREVGAIARGVGLGSSPPGGAPGRVRWRRGPRDRRFFAGRGLFRGRRGRRSFPIFGRRRWRGFP